jgi:hypothetical protein
LFWTFGLVCLLVAWLNNVGLCVLETIHASVSILISIFHRHISGDLPTAARATMTAPAEDIDPGKSSLLASHPPWDTIATSIQAAYVTQAALY